MKLLRYDAARQALAAAHRVDEVKDLRDKALALAAYAKQAKDTEMFQWVSEIRIRAERRTGELLRDSATNGTRQKGGNPQLSRRDDSCPTLSDLGITRNESSAWQKIAAIPEPEFERRLKGATEKLGAMSTTWLLHESTEKEDRDATAWEFAQAHERLRHAIQAEFSRWSAPKTEAARVAHQLRHFAKLLDQEDFDL